MKTRLLLALASAALCVSSLHAADKTNAILIGYPSVDAIDNFQESAAARHFTLTNPDGVVIAPGETSKISTDNLLCIWINIDRLNAGKGNLPKEFTDEATIAALKQFLAEGGSIYLSKHATQMLPLLGRIDPAFAPNIYEDADGSKGKDVWTVNAQIGYMNHEGENASQFYDRRSHEIYKDLAVNNDYSCETFGLLGTGDGTEMHRENHNCLWDLNAYSYTSEGANTVEKFEKDTRSVVLGTWGHVVDYAVAGIVEFLPSEECKGTIIANGLAAYEWAPREGVNGSHDNIKKLTDNSINYLAKMSMMTTSAPVLSTDIADAEYYTLQGVRVADPAAVPGLYIKRQGNKSSKVLIK